MSPPEGAASHRQLHDEQHEDHGLSEGGTIRLDRKRSSESGRATQDGDGRGTNKGRRRNTWSSEGGTTRLETLNNNNITINNISIIHREVRQEVRLETLIELESLNSSCSSLSSC